MGPVAAAPQAYCQGQIVDNRNLVEAWPVTATRRITGAFHGAKKNFATPTFLLTPLRISVKPELEEARQPPDPLKP